MTKQSNKGAPAASKEAADNWDDAPAPGSQNPEPKSEPGPKPENQPAEPTDKVSQDAAASTLKDAAANLPADPKSDEVAKRLKEITDKAKRLLVEQYGTENPEDLKASQLMDAIDDLYGAV